LLQKRSRRRVDPHAVVKKKEEEEERIDFPRKTERISKRKKQKKNGEEGRK